MPAPLTEVTEPPPAPAPIAVRNAAASRAETVLSALKRGNVTAPGLGMMKMLLPSVVAPSAVRAPAAVVAFVPPLAIGSVPETCVVRLTPDSAPPRVSVPDEVTVPVRVIPLTVPVVATEVTVPPLPVAAIVIVPAPFVILTPEPAVSVALVSVLPVVLPISNWPLV